MFWFMKDGQGACPSPGLLSGSWSWGDRRPGWRVEVAGFLPGLCVLSHSEAESLRRPGFGPRLGRTLARSGAAGRTVLGEGPEVARMSPGPRVRTPRWPHVVSCHILWTLNHCPHVTSLSACVLSLQTCHPKHPQGI